jgi:hypothetical protein
VFSFFLILRDWDRYFKSLFAAAIGQDLAPYYRLHRDDGHATEGDEGTRNIPSGQGDIVHDPEPSEGDGDIHASIGGIRSPCGTWVQGE